MRSSEISPLGPERGHLLGLHPEFDGWRSEDGGDSPTQIGGEPEKKPAGNPAGPRKCALRGKSIGEVANLVLREFRGIQRKRRDHAGLANRRDV